MCPLPKVAMLTPLFFTTHLLQECDMLTRHVVHLHASTDPHLGNFCARRHTPLLNFLITYFKKHALTPCSEYPSPLLLALYIWRTLSLTRFSET